MLTHLPPPPSGKTGWPWTEESSPLPPVQPDGKPWPRISIVTPSFNQGQYIEETIRSILLQNYLNLEYIIFDGGSTDETINIIEKYNNHINYWVSEPDNGQSHAINRGFLRCTGEFVNWICSDDMLCKNALTNIATLLTTENEIIILGSGFRIDQNGKHIDYIESSKIADLNQLVDIRNFWRRNNSILQQSTIYSTTSVKKAGLLNEGNYYTMDFELWGRLMINGISIIRTEIPIGMFRWYSGQKTSNQRQVTESLIKIARNLVFSNHQISNSLKLVQLLKILLYGMYYKYWQFRSFLGIKRRFRLIFND